jgi:hypothetical protein
LVLVLCDVVEGASCVAVVACCLVRLVGDVVFIEALALVAASALSGCCSALGFRGAVVDKVKVGVGVGASLVDDGTADGRGILW